ncbi:MAG: hypothetical protein KJ709_05720 [Nanoarchaeota archaeon]|nr:hypothetical protein [Nanoarchaeota archaeon]
MEIYKGAVNNDTTGSSEGKAKHIFIVQADDSILESLSSRSIIRIRRTARVNEFIIEAEISPGEAEGFRQKLSKFNVNYHSDAVLLG